MSYTDYALVRARSAAILPRSSSQALVTRSHSLSDLSRYYRWSDKYRPQWNTVYQYTPYRWRRDWGLYEDYWNDHYYDSSPLYNPYISPYTPYKRYYYRYDYDSPYYYGRHRNSAFNRYLNDTYYRTSYGPYRPYVTDSLSTSLGRGLDMYKAGLIRYPTLETYWLTPSYWDRRFKDWRDAYTTTPDLYLPSTFDRKTRSYFTSWNS